MVKVNIKMRDGHNLYIEYVCFGFLNQFCEKVMWEESSASDVLRSASLNGKPVKILDLEGVCDMSPSNIKYIDFIPEVSGVQNWYFKEAKILWDNLPMLQDCIKIMPRKKVIRAEIKNHAADKIILALMIFRNLAGQREDRSSYLFARKNGYSPIVSLAFTSFISIASRYNRSGPNTRSFYSPDRGESSILDPHTLGVKSLSNFLNQDKTYSPWFQEPFRKTKSGYLRDFHLAKEGHVFNPQSIIVEYDEWDEVDNSYELAENNCKETYFRTLVSCFSTEFKEDVAIPGLTQINNLGEFTIMDDLTSFESVDTAIGMLDIIKSFHHKD